MEPQTKKEFDVAIGARVKSVDGRKIVVVDDDTKVPFMTYLHFVKVYTVNTVLSATTYRNIPLVHLKDASKQCILHLYREWKTWFHWVIYMNPVFYEIF